MLKRKTASDFFSDVVHNDDDNGDSVAIESPPCVRLKNRKGLVNDDRVTNESRPKIKKKMKRNRRKLECLAGDDLDVNDESIKPTRKKLKKKINSDEEICKSQLSEKKRKKAKRRKARGNDDDDDGMTESPRKKLKKLNSSFSDADERNESLPKLGKEKKNKNKIELPDGEDSGKLGGDGSRDQRLETSPVKINREKTTQKWMSRFPEGENSGKFVGDGDHVDQHLETSPTKIKKKQKTRLPERGDSGKLGGSGDGNSIDQHFKTLPTKINKTKTKPQFPEGDDSGKLWEDGNDGQDLETSLANISKKKKKKNKRNPPQLPDRKDSGQLVGDGAHTDVKDDDRKIEDGSEDDTAKPSPGVVRTKQKNAKQKGFVLFVGQIAHNVKQKDLEKHFTKTGGVKEVRMLSYQDSGRSRGCAYVEFIDASSRKLGLTLNDTKLCGQKLKVEYPYRGGKVHSPETGQRPNNKKKKSNFPKF